MTPRRKAEIDRVRAEGYEAAKAGRAHETNPYPVYNSNCHQWWWGYASYIAEKRVTTTDSDPLTPRVEDEFRRQEKKLRGL